MEGMSGATESLLFYPIKLLTLNILDKQVQ